MLRDLKVCSEDLDFPVLVGDLPDAAGDGKAIGDAGNLAILCGVVRPLA